MRGSPVDLTDDALTKNKTETVLNSKAKTLSDKINPLEGFQKFKLIYLFNLYFKFTSFKYK